MARRRAGNIEAAADSGKPESDDDRLLRHREAARFLGVSESWLYASDIPFVRIAGRRYQLRELRAYIACRKTTSLDGSPP